MADISGEELMHSFRYCFNFNAPEVSSDGYGARWGTGMGREKSCRSCAGKMGLAKRAGRTVANTLPLL